MKNLPYILLSIFLGILVFGYLLFNSNLPFQFKDQAKFLQFVDYSLADGSLLEEGVLVRQRKSTILVQKVCSLLLVEV